MLCASRSRQAFIVNIGFLLHLFFSVCLRQTTSPIRAGICASLLPNNKNSRIIVLAYVKEFFMKTKKILVCGFLAFVFALTFGACSAAAQGQRLTGTDTFKFTVINNGTAYRVNAGTATEGTVNIPAYYRPNADSDYLPVKEIGSFRGLNNLIKIVIPEGVTSIVSTAFSNCYNLTSITIPNSVTSIGDQPFSSCISLTEINIAAGNNAFTIENGILYNKEKNLLHTYLDNKIVSFSIPNNVTIIGVRAFADCTSLINITIPNSVITIGGGAFHNCQKLTSVTIPNSVTSIGEGAFSTCLDLTSVTIGNGVTSIGEGAFSMTKLSSVTIPNSVTTIGEGAFYPCNNLTSVTIGNGVTSIGERAFSFFTNHTSVTFEGTIPSNGFHDRAFNINLYDKFYETDSVNGTPGTYIKLANSFQWIKQ